MGIKPQNPDDVGCVEALHMTHPAIINASTYKKAGKRIVDIYLNVEFSIQCRNSHERDGCVLDVEAEEQKYPLQENPANGKYDIEPTKESRIIRPKPKHFPCNNKPHVTKQQYLFHAIYPTHRSVNGILELRFRSPYFSPLDELKRYMVSTKSDHITVKEEKNS